MYVVDHGKRYRFLVVIEGGEVKWFDIVNIAGGRLAVLNIIVGLCGNLFRIDAIPASGPFFKARYMYPVQGSDDLTSHIGLEKFGSFGGIEMFVVVGGDLDPRNGISIGGPDDGYFVLPQHLQVWTPGDFEVVGLRCCAEPHDKAG